METTELAPFIHGVLPGNDITELYSSAKVVIGSTGAVPCAAGSHCWFGVRAGGTGHVGLSDVT